MRNRAKYACVLFFCLAIFGCSAKVSPEKVYGTYVASYPFGRVTLSLNRDGTFSQQIEIKGEQPLTVRGQWSYDSQASFVHLDGFIIVDAGNGSLSSDWRTPKSNLVLLDVGIRWFKVVMESAAEYPYVKQ